MDRESGPFLFRKRAFRGILRAMPLSRPKILIDLKSSRVSAFTAVPTHVNLSRRHSRSRFAPLAKTLLLLMVGAYALFGSAIAPSLNSFAAAPTAEERQQLEVELAQLEQQIADDEATVAAYRKQGSTLSSEIKQLNAKIDKLSLQIKVINLSLVRLNADINQNQQEINQTKQQIDSSRSAMAGAIQSIYENEQVSLVTVLLQNPNLSDFFSDINNLIAVQDSLTTAIQKIHELQDQLLTQQENLVAKKSDTSAFKALQDEQRQLVLTTKQQKDQLLTVTKGQEKTYQQLVVQKKETAAKIRSRIFALLGGGQMTFAQAYDFAKYAEQATGVSAAFLLAVLDRESALGKNVGRCSYHKAMAAGKTGKPPSSRDDVTPFFQITSELGLDPEKTQVSCANSDGAYGGAMGPAQFIPTTWMLYRDRIAKITGANPPSPWKNSDAFVGTALYLQDAMKACTGPTYGSGNGQIKCAAARYYAGGNWSRFVSSYGSGTLNRMQKFEDDIAVLAESNT